MDDKGRGEAGRFSYEGLDRVLHEKARLGILTSLAAHAEGLTFKDLKQLCALTDGNLSRHLGVLEEADLIAISKNDQGSRPQTTYRLTLTGLDRFHTYIHVLQRVIEDANTAETDSAARRNRSSRGWSPA